VTDLDDDREVLVSHPPDVYLDWVSTVHPGVENHRQLWIYLDPRIRHRCESILCAALDVRPRLHNAIRALVVVEASHPSPDARLSARDQ